MDCLFCKIVAGNIPAKVIYEDRQLIAVDDINPAAPTHKIVIPRKHITTINDIAAEDSILVGDMIRRASALAKELHIADEGYRLVFNCNPSGGQTIYHIHLHLLGGRNMQWPPG